MKERPQKKYVKIPNAFVSTTYHLSSMSSFSLSLSLSPYFFVPAQFIGEEIMTESRTVKIFKNGRCKGMVGVERLEIFFRRWCSCGGDMTECKGIPTGVVVCQTAYITTRG